MSSKIVSGRLGVLKASLVIARRDFSAVLLSRSFIFFLLGPLFPVVVGALAGGVGQKVQQSAEESVIAVVMQGRDASAILAARDRLSTKLGGAVPALEIADQSRTGPPSQVTEVLLRSYSAVLSGSLGEPELFGSAEALERWGGPIALIAGDARRGASEPLPEVKFKPTLVTAAYNRHGLMVTAQAAQTLLFLLTMLLAGMVLSNLVEEKGNKVIEILAAAIPMDAVFLGKLFAMLAVSMVGIAVWGLAIAGIVAVGGAAIPHMPDPAVGWPTFIALGVVYFGMAYLLLGSVFLTIGAMATTVREVQTLSMPVTMLQLMVFFLASYAMTVPGSTLELATIVFPFSSPYMMIARAAQSGDLSSHVLALAWQILSVAMFIRLGAQLFRKRVMKSGPAPRRRLFRSAKA